MNLFTSSISCRIVCMGKNKNICDIGDLMATLELNKKNIESILFIDDEKDLLDYINLHFADSYNVYTANNLVGAIKILNANKIDCIICDMNIAPDQSGLELYNICKMNNYNIPFILITGHLSETRSTYALQKGVTDVLEKPICPDYLSAQLNKYMQTSKKA